MKRIGLLALIPFILGSCSYYKIASVTSDKTKQVNKVLVFENDTIRVSYNFWAKNGAMSFDLYNKLNVPLYFDWKKSAFIPNDKMMSYWQDETNTTGISSSSAYYLYGGVIGGSNRSKSKSIRQERIGVIPPHAIISNNKYALVLPKANFAVQNYTYGNTPLRFRNYLAVSTSEQFDKDVFYIDNDFFVSNVKKIKQAKVKSEETSGAFYMATQ